MPKTFFVTGIDTEVGKTMVSATIVEALKTDYWKPIQAGDLENSDTAKVKKLITNSESVFHINSYALKTPMSPHAAAKIDEIRIDLKKINRPETENNLLIEGAGGLLVPLNEKSTIADLIRKEDHVILVSKNYLGSINHTLLSISELKQRGIMKISVVFNGIRNKSSEDIIEKIGKVNVLGRIEEEPYFDQNVVKEYAEIFKSKLENL